MKSTLVSTSARLGNLGSIRCWPTIVDALANIARHMPKASTAAIVAAATS